MRFPITAVLVLSTGLGFAAPPTDPKALELYNHCQEWLKKFPASYIATNIRGEGEQYAVRRQAALDLLRQKRDFGTVYELMVNLDKGSFLADQIIDILVEWKSRRAIPLLQQLAEDKTRSHALREKARSAVSSLMTQKTDTPPVYR